GIRKSLRLEVFFGIALVPGTRVCLGPFLHTIRRPESNAVALGPSSTVSVLTKPLIGKGKVSSISGTETLQHRSRARRMPQPLWFFCIACRHVVANRAARADGAHGRGSILDAGAYLDRPGSARLSTARQSSSARSR